MRNKKQSRWVAAINYHTPRKKDYVKFSELKELEKIINLGPNWFEIDNIEIALSLPDEKGGLRAYKESSLFN